MKLAAIPDATSIMTKTLRASFSQAFIDIMPGEDGNMEARLQMPSGNNIQLPNCGPHHLSLGRVFSTLEEAKDRGVISAYTVKETSLEQIFVAFAANRMFA